MFFSVIMFVFFGDFLGFCTYLGHVLFDCSKPQKYAEKWETRMDAGLMFSPYVSGVKGYVRHLWGLFFIEHVRHVPSIVHSIHICLIIFP
jgi:hypothetical protein